MSLGGQAGAGGRTDVELLIRPRSGRAVCLLVLDRACKCARVHASVELVVVLRLRSVQFRVLNQYEPICEHAYACDMIRILAKRVSELRVT